MNTDTVHGYHHAGVALSPVADWGYDFAATYGPGLLLGAALTLAWPITRCIYRGVRRASIWLLAKWRARDGLKLLASYANNKHTRHLLDDLNQPWEETP
jgi:hypothetical protein